MKKLIGMLSIVMLLIVVIFLMNGKEKVTNENVLVIGLDDSFPPMGFRNENNEIVGFDIDIAKAVCEKLGMEMQLQQISWASKEQELNSGNIDCIWNGFAYTEDRAKTMTLTENYIKGKNIFILKDGNTAKSQSELQEMKIGVQSGSSQQLDLENSEFGKNVEIIPYSDNLTAFMDLETGGVDSIFCSSIIGNYLIQSKNKNYETIDSENISVSNGSVVAFKQGNTKLRDKIQNALYELKADGTLDDISVSQKKAIRPVISLKASTVVIGDGTLENPYKIDEDVL